MNTYVDIKELNAILRSLEFVINRTPEGGVLDDLRDAQIFLNRALWNMEEVV